MSDPPSQLIPSGDLSKSEIIKKYSIGTGLDAFRMDFSSACEELGVPESSNTTQNLNDKGEMVMSGSKLLLNVCSS